MWPLALPAAFIMHGTREFSSRMAWCKGLMDVLVEATFVCLFTLLFCSPAHLAMRRVFGWTKKNEIGNGRWVMFGFAVGLLTEYATGVDFIDQLKMIVSFLGIADVE